MYLSRVVELPLLRAYFLIYLRTSCLSFLLPAGVANCIEKFQHDFLWGGLAKNSNINW
jgi:hypothetical protein